ncbi:aldo/keto reductase [Streptomyces sp. NPDC051771]|uniref:aldo/keto reductase n=1 Tax=Streptomyces sp. NPDC051771 TaxID=3154847 RepID=UPI003439CF0C
MGARSDPPAPPASDRGPTIGNTTTGQLARIAVRHGATPAQVELAWTMARSPVVLPIPGTSSVARVWDDIAAADLGLDAESLSERDVLPAPRWHVDRGRSPRCMTWGFDQERYDDQPGNVFVMFLQTPIHE